MPYSMRFAEDQAYIIVDVQGRLTRKMAMKINIESHLLGAQYNMKKYMMNLTDATCPEPPQITGYNAPIDSIAHNEDISASLLVVVTKPDDHSHDIFEHIAKDHGFRVKKFTDPVYAANYLKDPAVF